MKWRKLTMGFFLAATLVVPLKSYAGAGHGHGACGVVATESQTPWLGIQIQDLTDAIAASVGLEGVDGVIVSGVSKDGPADDEGIDTGDVIVGLDGKKISDARAFIAGVQSHEVGDTVSLEVNRGGDTETVEVVLGAMPGETSGHPACVPGACAGKGGDTCYGYGGRHGYMHDKGYGMGGHDGPFMMNGGMDYGRMYLSAMESLGLTAEQRKKTEDLAVAYKKRVIRSEAEIKISELDLQELLSSGQVSLDRVKLKINEIGVKMNDLRYFRIKALEDFKKILNPEQRDKLNAFMKMGHGPGGMKVIDPDGPQGHGAPSVTGDDGAE